MKIWLFCLWLGGSVLAGPVVSPPVTVPDSQAFQGWEEQKGEESFSVPLDALVPVQADCATPGLVPTHPQMSLKQYHLAFSGRYDHFRLTAASEACSFGGKTKNAKGVYPCFRPDTLVYVLLSDTYEDHCGHRYRGFSSAQFFRRDENMGTLFSPGRGSLPKENARFEGEYSSAPTYALKNEDFLFLTGLFPGDAVAIERGIHGARSEGLVRDERTGLFKRP
jgi:hypothetical protein